MAAQCEQPPQAEADAVIVCEKCGAPVDMIRDALTPKWRLFPCGHVAGLRAVRNPLLPGDEAA